MSLKDNLSSKDDRVRNFATVVYPESAPVDWLDILSSYVVPCFVSPLHDKDLNPGGEAKKPHYHVLLMFEGKKSRDQVRELVSTFGGVGLEVVQSIRGYARYLLHLDNPEKAQYLRSDILSFAGADFDAVVSLASDKYEAVAEMISFCIEHNVVSYSDLLTYCRYNNRAWFKSLCDCSTLVMSEFLKSRRWTLLHPAETVILAKGDPDE